MDTLNEYIVAIVYTHRSEDYEKISPRISVIKAKHEYLALGYAFAKLKEATGEKLINVLDWTITEYKGATE